MPRLVTVTGGLDSSWLMYRLVNQVDNAPCATIIPVYMDFGQGSKAAFAEFLLGSEITLRAIQNSRWYDSSMTWEMVNPSIFYGIYGQDNNRPRLIQQINVVTGLAYLANKLIPKYAAFSVYTGWNKADTIEENLLRAEWSEADYQRLRRVYDDLLYFQDHSARISPLLTPAWDKSKTEMWDALPDYLRGLVTVAPEYAINYHFCPEINELYIEVDVKQAAKMIRYHDRGIDVSVAWRISLDDAFYARVRNRCCPDTPLGINLDIDQVHKLNNFTLSKLTPQLNIKTFSSKEWLEHRRNLMWYLEERDGKRKAPSGDMDGSNGQMAKSVGDTTASSSS